MTDTNQSTDSTTRIVLSEDEILILQQKLLLFETALTNIRQAGNNESIGAQRMQQWAAWALSGGSIPKPI